jgi:aspartate beta-hydroxylase
MSLTTAQDIAQALQDALDLRQAGATQRARMLYSQVLDAEPDQPDAAAGVARIALEEQRQDDAERALRAAAAKHPAHEDVVALLSSLLATSGRLPEAVKVLEAATRHAPDAPLAWLLLSTARNRLGDTRGSLTAAHRAITRAQHAGHWVDESTTPRHLIPAVADAAQRVRAGRRELFFGAYDDLRAEHGSAAVARIDEALRGYLNEIDLRPPNPRQRPSFLYVPGLPDAPYQDPLLNPWARSLQDAFPQIRDEALRVVREDAALPEFIKPPAGQSMSKYLGGASPIPSWQAFFFYRRGKRYDDNHARCPQTSNVLDAIDLCRIREQAPEICFSVLRPGTVIKPHYGVTNARLVTHLPLVVPQDCALNVCGIEARTWREGELLMFDDTYEHEAWNHSAQTRIILLMDCWNPHLTPVERIACRQLIEMISTFSPHHPEG